MTTQDFDVQTINEDDLEAVQGGAGGFGASGAFGSSGGCGSSWPPQCGSSSRTSWGGPNPGAFGGGGGSL